MDFLAALSALSARFARPSRVALFLSALTLTGIDPPMLAKVDPLDSMLAILDPIDRPVKMDSTTGCILCGE